MFCAGCGQKNPDDAKFCPSCGYQIDGAGTSGNQVLVSAAATISNLALQARGHLEKEGVYFTIAIAIYVGFWSLAFLVFGGVGLMASLELDSAMSSLGFGGSGKNFFRITSFVLLNALGAFGLAGAYGLFKHKEWGRKSTIVVLIIWVILNVISLFGTTNIGITLFLTATYVGLVFYLNLPDVKSIFSSELQD